MPLGVRGAGSVPGAASWCSRPVVRPVARQTFHLRRAPAGISAYYRNSVNIRAKSVFDKMLQVSGTIFSLLRVCFLLSLKCTRDWELRQRKVCIHDVSIHDGNA